MASNFSIWFCVAKLNNKVKGAGYNVLGQLGNQTYEYTTTFKDFTIPNGYVADKIYSEYLNTIILMTDKTLWGCGANIKGGLGFGNSEEPVFSLTKMLTPDGYTIKSVSVGGGHTIILMTNGTVWGCGYNEFGQLGIQSYDDNYTFVQMIIPDGYTVDSIYCGAYNTFVVMQNGTVWGCGWNKNGSLGLSDNDDRNVLTQMTIPDGKTLQTISAGVSTFMLMNDGSLYGCGTNEYGQLGLGDSVNRNTFVQIPIPENKIVNKVYTSSSSTALLMSDRTFWVSGGMDVTNSKQFTLFFTPNNGNTIDDVYISGFLYAPSGSSISYLSSYFPEFHSYISLYLFMSNHSVWVYGYNFLGELGIGGELDILENPSLVELTQNPYVAYSDRRLTIPELKSINVNKYCYLDYGYTIKNLIDSNFTLSELMNAGYTKEEFASNGIFFNNPLNYCGNCSDC
jgi:alpha-tubulin suppressor-like RCC1 family protein